MAMEVHAGHHLRLRRPSFPELPWRRILVATAVALVVIAAIPGLRRAAARVVGDVIVFVATPIAPSIAGFAQLPGVTQLVAADGSPIGDLGADGLRDRQPVALSSLPEHVRNAV